MRLCPECKVYLSDGTEACPLCRTASVPADAQAAGAGTAGARVDDGIPVPPAGIRTSGDVFSAGGRPFPGASGESPEEPLDELSPRERRRMVFELVSVSVAIILIVTTGIDFLVSRGITWSLYSGISLAALWILSAAPLVLWERPALVFIVLAPAIVALSFAWFFLVGRSDLFLPLGLPITVAFEVSLLGPYAIVMRQRRKGLNAAGAILSFAVLLCLVVDASVSRFLGRAAPLSWSVIVCVSAIPVAGLFFYLHYRITNRASLRKLFRL